MIQDISIVAPSNWLLNKAKTAPIIESAKFYLIRNPVAETFHKNFKRDKSRKKRVLAFIALDLQNPFKGLDVYAQALNGIATPEWFLDKKLIFLGRGNLPRIPIAADVEKLSIEDESELHEKLLEVDLVVVPSNQDNFPNVIPEALLSGCALITSDAGGVSELSRDFNYKCFPAGDADALRLLLESHQFNEHASEERAEKAQRMFSSKVIAELYEHVYKI
jgi:glycosyltransferase involved in cell wall biosynthesis